MQTIHASSGDLPVINTNLFIGASTSSSSTTVTSAQASKQPNVPAPPLELDADELLTYKRRLLDMLQPQETVLAALRRLGGMGEAAHAGTDGLPWKRARKSAGKHKRRCD